MRFFGTLKHILIVFFNNKFTQRRQFVGDPNLLDENYNLNNKERIINPANLILIDNAYSSNELLYKKFVTSTSGLSEDQVKIKQEEFGLNQIEEQKKLHWYNHLWQCYKNPFNLLLTFLDIFFIVTDDIRGITVITSMIVISTVLRFFQERRSNKAADKLKEMVSTTATVFRIEENDAEISIYKQQINHELFNSQGTKIEIPIKELVPGDIISLCAGDLVPADVRILSA